jgi:hypothetical protein
MGLNNTQKMRTLKRRRAIIGSFAVNRAKRRRFADQLSNSRRNRN